MAIAATTSDCPISSSPLRRSVGCRRPDDAQEVPGRGDPREELLCELEGAAQRLLGRGDVVAVVLERMLRDRDRIRLVERAHLDELKRRREMRPLREEPLGGFRRRLGDDREVARLDGGEEGVQHPEAVLRVLSRVERSFEIG